MDRRTSLLNSQVNTQENIPENKHSQRPKVNGTSKWNKEERDKRVKLLNKQGFSLDHLTGQKSFEQFESLKGNIENFIGFSQVPTGVAGPVHISGENAKGQFYIPLATSEGTLVVSVNRGITVINLSGGAKTAVLQERVCRTPFFSFSSVMEAIDFTRWIDESAEAIRSIAHSTTRHGKLKEIDHFVLGKQVYLALSYSTADASGQNMVTIASDAVCKMILEHCPIRPNYWFIEGNLSGDKKATHFSFLRTRGKKVCAEVVIPEKVLERYLGVSSDEFFKCWKANCIGGIQSGSIGVNGHYANPLTAMFIACGQDAACASEASVGISTAEVLSNGDFYMSATLPNLIVGTVGGGCQLPTQNECLELLECKGPGNANKFAEICASACLAAEISLMGAVAAGSFSRAHATYGRKKEKPGDSG